MQNPFESGHIKNYILFYVSVVVIMILFFIASTLFHEIKPVDKKTFKSVDINNSKNNKIIDNNVTFVPKFKLLNKEYE
ncbi:MAG: hypothetical protein L3I99_04805 [Sulfurimonas sp.]|nr:hypothetical protein [Sulfurimonas sp.]